MRVLVVQTEADWRRWTADHPEMSANIVRVSCVQDAEMLTAVNPGEWSVGVIGKPTESFTKPIMEALSRRGFRISAVFQGGFPYR